MNELTKQLDKFHAPINNRIFRLLLMGLGLCHVGFVMWDPVAYAERIGGFNFPVALGLILSTCASVIFGVGFQPRARIARILFSPYLSLAILLILSFMCI